VCSSATHTVINPRKMSIDGNRADNTVFDITAGPRDLDGTVSCVRSFLENAYLPESRCHPALSHCPLRRTKTSVARPELILRWPWTSVSVVHRL
jgi:hypothetical protein